MEKLFQKDVIEQSEISLIDKKIKEYQISILLRNKMQMQSARVD